MAQAPALIAVFLRKRPDLVRFFARRTGSEAEAEDLVQEIFLKIRDLPSGDAVQSPEAFLYRVGSNLLLDRIKQSRRQSARDGAWRQARVGRHGDEAANEPAADDAVAARRRLEALVAALDELPPQTARAFRRHKFDGLSQGEVAAEMGVSRSSVEKYIMAALKHLLARVGE